MENSILLCSILCRRLAFTEGAKRKDSARDPIFGGSCVPKSLPLEHSPINRVLQVGHRIKRAKTTGSIK